MSKFIKFFTKIDEAVIDRVFQPVADMLAWVATPKQISLFCLMGDILSSGAMFAFSYANNDISSHIWDGIFFLVGPIIYWSNANMPETNGGRNYQRINPFLLYSRLFFLFTIPLLTYKLFTIHDMMGFLAGLSQVCFISFMYFGACDKRPPAKRAVWTLAPSTAR